MKKFIGVCVVLMMALVVLTVPAFAAGKTHSDKEIRIHVQVYDPDGNEGIDETYYTGIESPIDCGSASVFTYKDGNGTTTTKEGGIRISSGTEQGQWQNEDRAYGRTITPMWAMYKLTGKNFGFGYWANASILGY